MSQINDDDDFDFTYTLSAQSVERFARMISSDKDLDEVAEDLDDLIVQASHNGKIFRIHDAKAAADDTRIAFVTTRELQDCRVTSLVVVLRPMRSVQKLGDYGPGDSGMLALISLSLMDARSSLSNGTWTPYLASEIDKITAAIEEFDRYTAQAVDPRLAALKIARSPIQSSAAEETRARAPEIAAEVRATDTAETISGGWGSRADRANFVINYYDDHPDATMAQVSAAARGRFGAGIREKTIKKYLGTSRARRFTDSVLTSDKFPSGAAFVATDGYTARLVEANRAVARARASLRDAETTLAAIQDEAA